MIKILGKEIINRNMDIHDDTILVFLISRNANNLKHIKRILHLVFAWPNNPQTVFKKK